MARAAKPQSDPLILALDASAQSMLERLDSPENPATLSERVKVFEAVVSWASQRAKMLPDAPPAPTGKSKFDRLRAGFVGGQNANSSRGASPDDEAEAELN